MAWTFQQGRYKMECVVQGPLGGPSTVTVNENGRELIHEDLIRDPGEDQLAFIGRLWARVWELQEHYRLQAFEAFQREWDQ